MGITEDQREKPILFNQEQSIWLDRYLLEPMSALTHFIGALAALAGLIVLLHLTRHDLPKMISLLVYGASMVILFTASTLFHGIKVDGEKRMWLNRLDHVAIFLVIAGTYTPIVYNHFPSDWRWPVLISVWALAVIGMGYKLISRRIHGFFNASIYPMLSWAGVVPAVLASRIKPLVPLDGMALLGLGGLIYMLGFVVYYRQWPDPWPRIFGHHEIWHLFVLAGSLCHFLFMLLYVV